MKANDRRRLAANLRALVVALDEGGVSGPGGLASRLDGAACAVEALAALPAGLRNDQALREAATGLRRLLDVVDAGDMAASATLIARISGGADVLDAVAGPRQKIP
jgi:hypothetical protein